MGPKNALILALVPMCVGLLLLNGCNQRMLHTAGSKSGGSSALEVANAFDKYLSTYEPLYFALSKDGRYYYYTFCTKECLRDIDARSHSIRTCEIYSTFTGLHQWTNTDNTCRIFAKGQKVVWRGDIQGAISRHLPKSSDTTEPSSHAALSSKTDDDLCRTALSNSEKNQWGYKRGAVSEAKSRGLTPEICSKLLKGQAVQIEETAPKEANIEDRLTKLKNLYDKGLITKEEYENKQAEILEGL
jgi:hypothetical protein